jgi:uncharacterized caspase-like protein
MNPEDHAIIVGISRYPRFGKNEVAPKDLKGPDNDATSVYDWLTDPAGGGVPKDHAKIIRSQDFPDPFPDVSVADPQAEAIEREFNRLLDLAAKNRQEGKEERVGRRLYLYFSGHGYAPERGKGAIFSANATIIQTHHFPATAYATWLADAAYFDEVVLWMDCCMSRSISAHIRGTYPSKVHPNRTGKLFAAYAARWRKQAVEQRMDDGKYHGVFTYTLLEGLRGEAADQTSGEITSESLKAYLIHAMPRVMKAELREDPDNSQEPEFAYMDHIVFGSVPEVSRHTVRLFLPESALGKNLTVDGGPLEKPLSRAVAAASEVLELPNGVYVVEVEGVEKLTDFKVVGGQIDVQIGA